MKPNLKKLPLAAGFGILALHAHPALAQTTYQFEGTGTTAAPVSGNFSGTGFAPGLTTGDTLSTLSFGGSTAYTASDDLANVVSLNTLTFANSSAVTLLTSGASNTLSFGGTTPTINLNNVGLATVNLKLVLGATTTIGGTGNATFGGVISGAGGLTIGTPYAVLGPITMTAANTYTGTTSIGDGSLFLNAANGTLTASSLVIGTGGTVTIGATNGLFGGGVGPGTSVTLNSGGLLTTTSGVTTHIDNVNLNGGTLASGTPNSSYGSYALQTGKIISATANSTISATSLFLAAGSSVSVASGATLTDSGTIVNTGDGTSQLTLNGTGTLSLTGLNTYTGATTVNGGTLSLGYVSSGYGSLNGSNVVINNGGTVSVASNNSLFGYFTTNANTVTVNSGGVLTTASGVTSHIYGLTLNGGTLASVSPGTQYGSFAFNSGYALSATANSTISAADITMSTGTNINVASGVTLTETSAGSIYSGQLTLGSTGGTNTGTLALNGANAYTGTTTINSGNLSLGLAYGTLTGTSGVTINSGGTMTVATTDAFSTSGSIAVNAGGTLTTGNGVTTHINNVTLNGGTMSSGTGDATYGSYALQTGKALSATANSTISATSMYLASGSSVNVASGVTLADTGTIVDTGDGTSQLTVTGAGTLALSNTNTYTGGTTVNGGTLSLAATKADGSGVLTISSGATVAVAVTNAVGAGAVTLNGGTLANTFLNAGSASANVQSLGALTLGSGTSFIDFGAGNTGGSFDFALSGTNFAGTLDVLDWNGLIGGTGLDQLYFGSITGGLSAAQAADILFINPNGVAGTYAAVRLANGQIVANVSASSAAPEPGSLNTLALGGLPLLGGFAIRRRKISACSRRGK